MDHLHTFFLSFIPLLVAIDAPGTLPLYISMTEGLNPKERGKIVRQSIVTAFFITIGFMLVGRAIFSYLSITVEDFMIAGGVVLLIIAIIEIVRAGEKQSVYTPSLGVVPLGTPIIAGPATLTTTLMLAGAYGYGPVILSLIVNILFAWLVFAQANRIIKLIGVTGTVAVSKVVALLLAAIAVKMIRVGIFSFIDQ